MLAFERAARRASSLAELNGLFGREVRRFGFTAYAAGFIPRDDAGAPETARDPFLLLDWPRAWLELYARQGFAQEDAVVAAARTATAPFTWRQLQARQPGASARIFAAASAFGWNDGLLVPARDQAGSGPVGVVSLAASTLDHLDETGLGQVTSLSLLAFRRARECPKQELGP